MDYCLDYDKVFICNMLQESEAKFNLINSSLNKLDTNNSEVLHKIHQKKDEEVSLQRSDNKTSTSESKCSESEVQLLSLGCITVFIR